MSSHAPFPPSATKRWKICTGSFALGLQVPEPPETEYAADGTRLHAVAREALVDKTVPSKEDAAALKPFLDYVARIAKTSIWLRVEQWINHSALLSGTPDVLAMHKDATLEVVDLKNGAGILVDPVENDQMLTYAYMALRELEGEGLTVPWKIRLTVVQPPDEAKQVKSWDTTRDRVLEHGKAIGAAIQTALEGRGELVPGDHCRFCKAKAICPKLRGEVVEALGGTLPSSLTPAALATWLDRADRMEKFIDAVREAGHDVASRAVAEGTPGIPGWGLKPKRATRSWADEDKVLEIARKRRIKIWQDKLLSPAMAEKEHPNLPQELREQIVAVSSGMNLVRLKAGEAPMHTVKVPEDASKKERLQANIALMKFRR